MFSTLKRPFAILAALLLMTMAVAPALADFAPEPGPFYDTWERTDRPVADGDVSRTWIWGPDANTEVMQEPYVESPGGERDVQYYDKSRMEINDPNAVNDGLWFVTNGLLVVELMTGNLQLGDDTFEQRSPADINIVGDPGFAETPTYADYADLMDTPAFAEGSVITATVDGDGNIGSDDSRAEFNVTADVLAPETGHRTASIFWEFMTSSGLVYEDDQLVTDLLFENPYYATGYPITEAYWSNVSVAGSEQWVLTQAFERRVLTYTPTNNEGFQVEAGNVGLHYFEWRYGGDPMPPPVDPTDPVEVADQAFVTTMTVEEEVPAPTLPEGANPSGDAVFFVNAEGNLEFEIYVIDIQNVTAAHIHVGAVGEAGPVVVGLFGVGEGDPVSTSDGEVTVLASGEITADMLTGPLAGLTLGHLLAEMEAGNTYVNVHTTQNPAGEIRGQLELGADIAAE